MAHWPAIDMKDRERIDLRVELDLRKRMARQAKRYGLTLSAYLRMAVTERLERDEIESKVKRKPPADDAD